MQKGILMLPWVIVALYILLPITLLSSHALPSAVFYLLVASCWMLLAQQRFSHTIRQTREYCWLIASYGVLFLIMLVSSWYHGEWAGANSEGAVRFFLGLWTLLLALNYIDRGYLRNAIWGVYIAGLGSTIILIWLILYVRDRPLTPGVIITTYSSIMLLLSTISLYSLKWRLTPWFKFEVAIKIGVFGITFIGFLAAQTRTGLLGLPIFIILGLLLFTDLKKPRRLLVWLIVSATVIGAAVASNTTLRERIVQGIDEVQACQGANSTQYSSMCIRLQLWRTAIDVGVNYPWVGLGDGSKFINYLQDVAVPKGLAAQYVVDEYFGEPHNDLMLMLVGFGIPGVFGLLLIYIVPCTYFLPRFLDKARSSQARAAAAMGLAVCLGFLLFGLTETMFRRMNTIGFYTAMVALFMVLSDPRPSQQDKPAPPALP